MDDNFRNRFANTVKELRGDRSQNEFAAILKISQATVAGWEKGQNIPNLENIEKLASLANECPEEFLAKLYGRQISTKSQPEIEEQIKSLSIRRLAALLITIGVLLAGDPSVDDTDIKKNINKRGNSQEKVELLSP